MIRQINGFNSSGFGGIFLHSRAGLLTEYMGKEWWEAMDVAVRTSKKIGIKAWFYDEDKWPSGNAGGKIPLMSEDFHARCLSRVDKNEKLDSMDQVLFEDDHFKYIIHIARMGESWFNGTCYADFMNPKMVKAFIDSAYTPYIERYKDEIGKTVPGIFTDEPQIWPKAARGKDGSVSFHRIFWINLKRCTATTFYPLFQHCSIRLAISRKFATSIIRLFRAVSRKTTRTAIPKQIFSSLPRH